MRRYPLPPSEPIPPKKEDSPCCVAKRDDLGRLPVGFCDDAGGPPCVRRTLRDRRIRLRG